MCLTEFVCPHTHSIRGFFFFLMNLLLSLLSAQRIDGQGARDARAKETVSERKNKQPRRWRDRQSEGETKMVLQCFPHAKQDHDHYRAAVFVLFVYCTPRVRAPLEPQTVFLSDTQASCVTPHASRETKRRQKSRKDTNPSIYSSVCLSDFTPFAPPCEDRHKNIQQILRHIALNE